MTYYGISGATRATRNKSSNAAMSGQGAVRRTPVRITPAVPSTARVNGRTVKNSAAGHTSATGVQAKIRTGAVRSNSVSADTTVRRTAQRSAHSSRTAAVRTRINTASNVRVRTLPKAKSRVKYIDTAGKAAPMPIHLICGAVMITLLFLFFVFNCVQLNEYNAQTVQLKKQINSYKQEYVSLENQLEQREDLSAIEQQAISMGMIKKELLPRKYVSVIDGDKIEVIKDETEQGGISTLLSGISQTILNLKEYLNS